MVASTLAMKTLPRILAWAAVATVIMVAATHVQRPLATGDRESADA